MTEFSSGNVPSFENVVDTFNRHADNEFVANFLSKHPDYVSTSRQKINDDKVEAEAVEQKQAEESEKARAESEAHIENLFTNLL